jgi:hypothetical protein
MRLGGEGTGPAVQPVLQVLEPADGRERLVHRVVLEEPALPDELALLVHDPLDVRGVEAVVLGNGLGEGVLGLLEGEAQGGLDQLLALLPLEVHRDAAGLPEHAHDLAEEIGQLGEGRERDVEDGDLLLQLHGELKHGRQDEDRRVAALQRLAELSERADQPAVVEPGMEVLEDDQGGFLESAECLERGEGVLGLGRQRDPAGLVEAVEPAHGRPADERLAVAASDAPEELLHPAFLGGDEVDQRVARTDEGVQLADEAGLATGGDGALCCLGHGVPAA